MQYTMRYADFVKYNTMPSCNDERSRRLRLPMPIFAIYQRYDNVSSGRVYIELKYFRGRTRQIKILTFLNIFLPSDYLTRRC
jgi:hypothetical protein